MAANEWLMQTLADQLRIPVERPVVLETTAWGAARLAGMHAGIYPPLGEKGVRRVEQHLHAAGEAGGERRAARRAGCARSARVRS